MHQIQVKPTVFKVVITKLTTWRTIQPNQKYSVTHNCFSLMIGKVVERKWGGGKLKINKKAQLCVFIIILSE